MAWAKTPTAAGQIIFAKGRLRKWSTAIQQGAKFVGRHGDTTIRIDDPSGLTAMLKTGHRVLAHRVEGAYGDRVRYTVVSPDGAVKVHGAYGVAEAVCSAVGGDRKFVVGNSTVYLTVAHRSQSNKLVAYLNFNVPNPEAEWEGCRMQHFSFRTDGPDVVWMAVGVLMEGGDTDILPLLDKIQEVYPGKADVPCGRLFSEPVPVAKLKRTRFEFVEDSSHPLWRGKYEVVQRTEYMTGEPVEGPEGQWH
jgi:hypothetical protein